MTIRFLYYPNEQYASNELGINELYVENELCVAQNKLINVRKNYYAAMGYPLVNKRGLDISEDGYCHGLTLHWGLSKHMTSIHHMNKFSHHEITIKFSKWKKKSNFPDPEPIDEALEKRWGIIEWIQNSDDFESNLSQARSPEVLSTLINQPVSRHFTACGVFKKNELLKLLTTAIKPKEIIKLCSGWHAVGIYKEHARGPWYFYDPNIVHGELVCDKIEEVIELLQIALCRIFKLADDLIPLTISTYQINEVLSKDVNNEEAELAKNELYAQPDFFNRITLSGLNALWLATQENDIKTLELIFADKKNVKKLIDLSASNGKETFTPLYLACRYGNIDMVKFLLTQKLNIDETSSDKETALMLACDNENLHIVEILLKAGANPNLISANETTALSIAVSKGTTKIIKLLLKNHAEPNFKRSSDGASALHLACAKGNIEQIELLVKYGADIKDTMSDGATPLYLACKHDIKIATYLLGKYKQAINMATIDGKTPLMAACQYNFLVLCKLLINNGADTNASSLKDGYTALHYACQNGNEDIVGLLLKNRAKVNQPCSNGMSALHFACQKGDIEVVKRLVQYNANIEALTNTHKSTLLIAFLNGKLEVAKFILEQNEALAIIPADDGSTPLHWACQHGALGLCQVLIKKGANVNATITKIGVTPLHCACQNGEITLVNYLLKMGANVNVRRSISPSTPLEIAIAAKNLELVNILLAAGANTTEHPLQDSVTFFSKQYKPCQPIEPVVENKNQLVH